MNYNRSYQRRFLQILVIFSLLVQPLPVTIPKTAMAIEANSDPTGGHLGWPASPALDLRTAADAHVTPIGSYKTSVPIEIPGGPGAPALSLNYNSASETAIAGVGWDLSVGWPTLIGRDTRFGTPTWTYNSPWTWGGTSLVVENAQICQQKGICTYRTAPDSLAIISINQITITAAATVTLISGVQLFYEAVRYDGINYPVAPPGDTNVFAYLLRRVRDPNGYLTCFYNQHWGDPENGRAAVLKEIRYGVGLKDCETPMNLASLHRIEFDYIDPTDPANGAYFAPLSYRFGAPVSFNNLLSKISVYAADGAQTSPEATFRLEYQGTLGNPETRRPRLGAILQGVVLDGTLQERFIRQFTYGNRASQFDATPKLLDLGRDATEMPPTLAGSVSRPILLPQYIDNPGGVFQIGRDQKDVNAPVAWAVTQEWRLTDINADGLMDTLVADERGLEGAWKTFEREDSPGPRPAQQWVFINEGIAKDVQLTSRVILTTSAPLGTANRFDPEETPATGFTHWIWQEGRGKTRTGMPLSVTSPEVADGGLCPPLELHKDTRIWPIFPDSTPAVRARSIIDNLDTHLWTGGVLDSINKIIQDHTGGFMPRSTVSAQVSDWIDINGTGLPNWVVTPGMIERFDLPPDCQLILQTFGHQAHFAETNWYSTSLDPRLVAQMASVEQNYEAYMRGGPEEMPGLSPELMGLPLSWSNDYTQGDFLGQTIPVGTWAASTPALLSGPYSYAFWQALANLEIQTLTPRSQAGVSAGLDINVGSVHSVLSGLANAAGSGFSIRANASAFANVGNLAHLDVTLLSGGSHSSNQTRAQIMDFNADGCPDYLLYDSLGYPAGATATGKPGGLLLFQNDCDSGFLPPVRVNDGYDTGNQQAIQKVQSAVNQISHDPVALVSAWLTCSPDLLRTVLACGSLEKLGQAASQQIKIVAQESNLPLNSGRDTLPTEKAYAAAALVVAGLIDATMIPPGVDPPLGISRVLNPNDLTKAIIKARQLGDVIAFTVALRAYPSRLNMLSAGASYSPRWQDILRPGYSMSVQTEGLVDLNGDALLDMVLTQNDKTVCVQDQWEVYWGTGTSHLAENRGFTSAPTCIDVPAPPSDVKDPIRSFDIVPLGTKPIYHTLPLQVDFSRHIQTGLWPQIVTNVLTHNRVSLADVNQDGRPDLMVAKENGEWTSRDWDPADPSFDPNVHRIIKWSVYLNKGIGFSKNKLELDSVGGTLPGVSGAQDVPYPAVKSSFTNTPIVGGARRSGSSVEAGLLDVDHDGTADIAERVSFLPAEGGVPRAGILYWSRAGNGPQDLLLEELEPLTGARTLVTYAPAARFQWPDGLPDGNTPPGGHRIAAGMTAFMVQSVTVEPLAGSSFRRTRLGYDYKDPYFDAAGRVFRGFGRMTVTPLDPETGNRLRTAASVVVYHSQASEGRGGETLERLIDGNGAPIAETMYSYTDTLSLQSGAGSNPTSYFSARQGTLTVEYPPDLRQQAVLDLGFDGRWPLANRVDRATLPLDLSPRLTFDEWAATGGGVRFEAAKQQRIRFTAPQPNPNLQTFTLEAWVNPAPGTGRRVIFQHSDGYELAIDSANKAAFAVNIGGNWMHLTGSQLTVNAWSHLAASYDGTMLRLFVNGIQSGVLAVSGTIPYPATPTGRVRIGCGLEPSNGQDRDCFDGELGELRLYAEAWQSPPRITESRTAYRLAPLTAPDFGLPVETWDLGDLATPSDDLYQAVTYARPTAGGLVRNQVATQEQQIFKGPNPHDLGGYLGYREIAYDGLDVGEAITGNVTMQAVYSGLMGDTNSPEPDTVTLTRYTNPGCPGLPTEVEDALGGVTHTTYDGSCALPLSIINALGHTTINSYYGVNGVPYQSRLHGVTLAGRYGQIKSATDPNSAQTLSGYDEWGRPTVIIGTYDVDGRPGIRFSYQDPILFSDTGPFPIPAQVKTETWDDIQHDYITSYAFGDGQTQVEALKDGKPDWLVSGTQDFDAAGRVITTYKVRFLSAVLAEAASTTMGHCSKAGEWCNFVPVAGITTEDDLKQDPLRNPAKVAHIQSAYDQRGRMIRVYGPDVPWCGDPSALDAAGSALLCDSRARSATPSGHYTSYEYPDIGVVRLIDERGVPTVSRYDVHQRLRRSEEYERNSTLPYAYADYGYDSVGNLITVTDIAGNTTTATYDALGRKLTSADPDMGLWRYTYDKRGDLLTQTDARGAKTVNQYDPLGRILRTEYFQPPPPPILDRHYTFDDDPEDSERTHPMFADGSELWKKVRIPTTENRVLFLHTNQSDGQRLWGRASFEIDLTQASEAELSFRQGWNTRCARVSGGVCSIDQMSVEYSVSGSSTIETLLPHTELTTDPPVDLVAVDDLTIEVDLSGAPMKHVRLPDTAMGKWVTIYFRFDSIDPVSSDPFSGWMVDDIRLTKRLQPTLEERIERQYDSAELASAYLSSVLDLTFDVPDALRDRSHYQHVVETVRTQSVEGVSGRGVEFLGRSSSTITVKMSDVTPLTSNVTVEAWVNPRFSSSAMPQYLIFKDDEYALVREADDRLLCQVFVNGAWQTATADLPLPLEVWSHVALTYDGNELRCYVNGIQWANSTTSKLPLSGNLTLRGGTVTIGSHDDIDGFFEGELDEVRVLDLLREPSEVLTDALSPLRHGPPRGNVLDLPFANPDAPQLDLSGANNHVANVFAENLTPGIAGTSLRVNQDPAQAVVVATADSLNSNEVTAETWINTDDQGDRLLIGKWQGYREPGWRLALDWVSGRVRFEVNVRNPLSSTLTHIDFVTAETVNNQEWHHVAGTFDGKNIRVYVDGKPAHRICTRHEIDEDGRETGDGTEVPCEEQTLPDPECVVEHEAYEGRHEELALNVCIRGNILSEQPVFIGAYDQQHFPDAAVLSGTLDEVRLSNYAKRNFEIAASARPYNQYSQALGQQVAVRNHVSDDTNSFDLLGRPVSTQRQTHLEMANVDPHDGSYLVRSAYDNLGRNAALRYPDGEVVVSHYDRGGAQTRLIGYGNFSATGDYFGRQPYLTGANLTATGRLAQLYYGNGIQTSFLYDEGPTKNPATGTFNSNGTFGNELLSHQVTILPPNGTVTTTQVLQDQHYKYDPVGNLLNRQDFVEQGPTMPTAPYTATYAYEDLGRLTNFTAQFGATPAGSGVYSYDALGNLTNKEGVTLHYGGQPECSRTVPPPHAVTESVRGRFHTHYCYDANGSLATANHTDVRPSFTLLFRQVEYMHNVRGLLTSILDIKFEPSVSGDPITVERLYSFDYDADGRRVHKVEPPLSSGDAARVTTDLFPFYRITNEGVEKYYFAAGRLIARRTAPDLRALFWYHPEHLGSTNLMTDSFGRELTDAYSEYMPFGDRLSTPGNTPVRAIDHSGGYQFTGKELDDTGLYDYGARYYDPVIGRFIEADSITPDVWPQSLNRYSYVLNNPLKYVDPSGHEYIWTQDAFDPPIIKGQLRVSTDCSSCTLLDGSLSDPLDAFDSPDANAQQHNSSSINGIAHGAIGGVLRIGGEISVLLGIESRWHFEATMARWNEAGVDYNSEDIQNGQDLAQGLFWHGAPFGPKTTLNNQPGIEYLHGKGHGATYKRAKYAFVRGSLFDPLIPRHIRMHLFRQLELKGWSGYWKNPVGFDVGHIKPGLDEPWNLRWENADMNRFRGGKYKR